MLISQILLENVEDLFNIGAIIRLADGFGIPEIILLGKSPRFFDNTTQQKKIKNYARQGLGSVSIKYYESMQEYRDNYRYPVAIIELSDTAIPYTEIPRRFSQPYALLLGGEHHGVSQETLNLNFPTFSIPMHGKNISHNVAQSAAIVIGYVAGCS